MNILGLETEKQRLMKEYAQCITNGNQKEAARLLGEYLKKHPDDKAVRGERGRLLEAIKDEMSSTSGGPSPVSTSGKK